MTVPFTPDQSAEIDRRLVKMVTAAMGVGQYSSICQDIADRRAEQFAEAASMPISVDRRMACLELAVRNGADDPVACATDFEAFVTSGSDGRHA